METPAIPSSHPSQNFQLKDKWNSNFPETPFGNCGLLQSIPTFSFRNGTSEISLPFAQFPSSSLPSNGNNNRKSIS